jgi:quinol monooxygenase YgiN
MDILLWVEGYPQMVAVLASLYPSYIHEFMAYLRTIVRASRNYEGSAWAAYDVAYWR